MKYLFVGGPKHGEQINVRDDQRVVIVPVEPEGRYTASYDYIHHDSPRCLNLSCVHCCPQFGRVEYERRDVGTDKIVYIAKRLTW